MKEGLRFLVVGQLLYFMHSWQPCVDHFAKISHVPALTNGHQAACVLRLRGNGADGDKRDSRKGKARGKTAGTIEELFEQRERLGMRRYDTLVYMLLFGMHVVRHAAYAHIGAGCIGAVSVGVCSRIK
jgi:hypothetical protein